MMWYGRLLCCLLKLFTTLSRQERVVLLRRSYLPDGSCVD